MITKMLKSLKKTLYKKMHISLMRMIIINTNRRKIFDTNVKKRKKIVMTIISFYKEITEV